MTLKDANIEITERTDFSGGWSRSRRPEPNESPDCLNVIAVDDKLTHISGETLLESGQVYQPSALNEVYSTSIHENTADIIVQTADKLYRITNVTSPLNLAPSDITGSVTFAIPSFHPSTVHYNDNLIGTDPNNPIWTVGETGNATEVGGTAPQSAYALGVFKDRLIAAGIKLAGTWYYTAVVYSDSDDSSSFDTTFNRWEIETDSKEYCVHVSQLGNDLFIYKTNGIARISGFPPYDWTVERAYINGIGPVGRDCVKRGYLVIKGNAVEVDFFISYSGLYAFDGSSLIQLPFGKDKDYFRSFWKDILWDTVGPHWVTAAFDEDNGYYKVYFTEGCNGSIKGIIYDAVNNTIWPITAPAIPNTMAFGIVPSDTDDLHHHIIYGHSNGTITRETETSSLCHTGSDLVTNGSMEDDSNWTLYDPDTTGTVSNTRDSGQSYNGTYSRRITLGAGSTTGGAYQTIAGLTVGSIYRVYGRVKQEVDATSSIIIKDSTGAVIASASPSGSFPWEDMAVTFVATTTSMSIYLTVITLASDSYFDLIQLFELDRNVYYKSAIMDMGSEYTAKTIKEMGIEHSTSSNSAFTVRVDYDDDIAGYHDIAINQTPTATETSRVSPCTSTSDGISGKVFRRCQVTLTLANTTYSTPNWEISAILMSYNPISTRYLFSY